ncbi:MAG: hypothetical protein U0175_05710 [Caldilineaceae bacterium]
MLSAALIPVLTAMVVVERAIEIVWNYTEWFLVGVRKWDGEALKRSDYLHFKSATSLLLGMILGVLMANFAGMHLLFSAGINNVAPAWDLLITGILIGTGTKPIHDLLGILTQFKNFLASSALMRREEAGRALAEGVLRLAQSEAQGMVDVPGVGPARLSPPGMRSAEYNEDDELGNEERSQIERYAAMLHKSVQR